MTPTPTNDNREPLSPFGQLLVSTMRSCEGRSCEVLDRVLTARVRAWADEQEQAQ
jgi:hypothetical protein